MSTLKIGPLISFAFGSSGRDFGYVFDKLMSTVSTLFGNVLNCIIVVLLTFKMIECFDLRVFGSFVFLLLR